MDYNNNTFFSGIDINQIAKKTKFIKRKPKKISPLNYLLSFFIVCSKKNFSLRSWACELSELINQTVSHQAIDKKLQIRHLGFVKEVFKEAISQCFKDSCSINHDKLNRFGRVLIEDSTCVKMANSLFKHFSGASNASSINRAIARIQFCFDLKNNSYENLELTTYTKNDLAFSNSILRRAEKGDLIIRDLGYWKLSNFKNLNKNGVYFLSKFRLGTKVLKMSEKEINLVSYLKNLDKEQQNKFDLRAKIGGKEKVELRIFGYKLSEEQAVKKKIAAKKSRHKNTPISKSALYLMTWNIFITNVEEDYWTIEDAYEVYRLRWQIEMIFKNWKSNFKVDKIMQSCKSQNPIRPEILLYLNLLFMTVVYQPSFNYYRIKVYEYCGKHLSPLKFGQFVCDKFSLLIVKSESFIINLLSRFFCYDTRQDRINFSQLFYQYDS